MSLKGDIWICLSNSKQTLNTAKNQGPEHSYKLLVHLYTPKLLEIEYTITLLSQRAESPTLARVTVQAADAFYIYISHTDHHYLNALPSSLANRFSSGQARTLVFADAAKLTALVRIKKVC